MSFQEQNTQFSVEGDNEYLSASALKRAGKFVKKKATGIKTDAKNIGKGTKRVVKASGKAVKQAAKYTGSKVKGLKTDMANIKKAVKTDLANAWKMVKKYSPIMVLARSSFRLVVRVNLWALASDIKKLKDESEKGNSKSKSKYDSILRKWESYGGSKSELIKTVISGAKNPVFHKERKHGVDAGEYFNTVTGAEVAAAVAAGSPIIVAVIGVVGKNKNNSNALSDPDLNKSDPERDAALAQEQAEYEKLTPDEKAAFQATTAGDPVDVSPSELASVTSPDGTIDKIALAKIKAKKTLSSMPKWGYAAILGGIAVIGTGIYLLTTKNK